jgi:hypothetical protein
VSWSEHHSEGGQDDGGCFFIAASIDPARNRGPVKEALAESQRVLLDFFADEIATAQGNAEAPAATDPRQVAFEIDALLAGADLNYLLFDDPEYLERAKRAVRVLLVHTDDATR